jgi:hypothetical protein
VIVSAKIAALRAGLGDERALAEGVRIVAMPRLVRLIVGRNVQAITLTSVIFVQPKIFDRVVSGDEPELLLHELTHVSQWRDHGAVDFTKRYVTEYARLRFLGADHDAAYHGIGFEHVAYDVASRWQNRAA